MKAPAKRRARAAKRPRKQEADRVELAMRAINEGVYEWNIADGSTVYSDRVLRSLGLSRRQLRNAADWHQRIHPEDRARFDAALVAHFKGRTERFECDFRYRGGDGVWHWARQHGVAIRDAKGRAVRMIGSTGDITELKRVEEALKASEERYALATRAATEGIYEWNLKSGSLFLSDRAKEFFAVAGEALTPAAWNARVHGEDFQGYRDATVAFFKGVKPVFEHEYRIRDAAGGYAWVRDRAIAVRDPAGRVTRLVGALTDITQRRRAELELRRAHQSTTQALTRQTATAEILKAIAASPTDVRPVLQALARHAGELCGAAYVNVLLEEGDMLRTMAVYSAAGGPPADTAFAMRPVPTTVNGRAFAERRPVHVPDFMAVATSQYPDSLEFQRRFGFRTIVGVPMLRGERAIGTISIWRREVRPFSAEEIGLIETFAAQAVIAIENVRLFNETKEALEQQTATTNILNAISRSLTDLAPVFEAILENAITLCEGNVAALWQYDGTHLRFAAGKRVSPEAAAHYRSHPLALGTYNPTPQAALERRALHVLDVFAEPTYRPLIPRETFTSGPYAPTVLAVPLLRENDLLGVVTIWRYEKRLFTDRQVAMVNTFAAQAVIAIENVRLFNETTEALERQTATAEILKVISASPTSTEPVFESIVNNCRTLFKDSRVAVWQIADGMLVLRATNGYGREPMPLDRESGVGACVLESRTIHLPDLKSGAEQYPRVKELGLKHGYLSGIYAPLLREGRGIGAISVLRHKLGAFTDKEVALLGTFANQAVIAIENARLFNETKEAFERQKASAEILGTISSSIADTEPVFEKILESCERLFAGRTVGINVLGDDGMIHLGAYRGAGRDAFEKVFPLPVDANSGSGLAIVERRVVHIPDSEADGVPEAARRGNRARGNRASLYAPMVSRDKAIGVIWVARELPGPFSETEISLLKTFADQAVIAIENARLFNETKEALEQQTASSQILGVISSSVTDLRPVFDAILESATRLCDAHLGVLNLFEGDMCRTHAQRGGSPEFAKWVLERGAFKPAAAMAHVLAERKPFQVPDAREGPGFKARNENAMKFVELGGVRTYLAVPLVKEGAVIGSINIFRPEVRPFTDTQIALVSTFANQAVIAIENARLFNETKESLEQQTASADILRVISSTPSDTQPVFEAIVQAGLRVFAGAGVGVVIADAERVRVVAAAGVLGSMATKVDMPRSRESATGTAVVDGVIVNIRDTEAPDAPLYARENGRALGFRAIAAAPMLRDGKAIGAIGVVMREAGGLTDKQIALLRTFADQAVIAIENARLINETTESLEQQTAISEVLRVISSSPADIKPVLDVVASRAAHICDATDARIFVVEGDFLRHATGFGDVPVRTHILPITRASTSGRAVIDRTPVHVPDIEAEPPDEFDREIARKSGWRSSLAVPLMREKRALGAIVLRRREVRPFTEKQVTLLTTFADQAAIAIENVRLFNETKEALERQTATGEILKVMSASLTDVQPVFDAVALNAARVCGVDDVAILQTEGADLRRVSHFGNVPVSPDSLVPVPPGSVNERVLSEHRTLHIPDTLALAFTREFPGSQFPAMGVRALLATPLVRDGVAVGVIHLRRSEARPFTDKQIAMLETFADQAVIAIENVRLFNEIRDSLEQQKASAEVLAAISSSIADTQPVFDKILRSCERLFAGKLVGINLVDPDGLIRIGAYQGPGREDLEKLQPFAPGEGSGSGAAILHRRLIQYVDAQHGEDTPPATRRGCAAIGVKSVVFAPMIWEERAIGVIFVGRDFAGAFSEKEIALLRTFADQAVIAIQNARLFREIAEKSRQLEEASRHKSQFLASMSHELRTPLNAILGFNEMILGQIYGEVPPDMKEPLEDIQKSGKHLLRLINNVLDLAKIEAGKMELALADYSVQDTVESVRSTLRPLAEAKGLELVVSVPEDIPLAYGDGGRVTQCLMNLAGNSLKFTKQGKVEIAVEAENGHLRWRVADTGIGIPPDKISTLFSEFKQTDATIASEYGGTGLGLSITRKFVEMHGGRIWVESELGKGSVFTLEIPLRVAGSA